MESSFGEHGDQLQLLKQPVGSGIVVVDSEAAARLAPKLAVIASLASAIGLKLAESVLAWVI
jgi:hypothetical protein